MNIQGVESTNYVNNTGVFQKLLSCPKSVLNIFDKKVQEEKVMDDKPIEQVILTTTDDFKEETKSNEIYVDASPKMVDKKNESYVDDSNEKINAALDDLFKF